LIALGDLNDSERAVFDSIYYYPVDCAGLKLQLMISTKLLLLLHVGLYSFFPIFFGSLSRGLRSYAYYLYIALVLMLGGVLGVIYSLPITDSISISGGNLCFAAFWMATILLLVSENSLAVVRSIILLVVVVNSFLLGAYKLFGLALSFPETINPFDVPSELFASSIWIVVLGGVLIIAELLLLVWVGERAKTRFSNPVMLGFVLVGLMFAVLIFDGILFPLIFMPFNEESLNVMGGGVVGKLLLGALFSVPLILHFFVYSDVLRNFQRVPIRLSELFKRRAAARLGSDPHGPILADQTKEQLRVLVERLSTAAAAADMGIWEYDGATGTLDWDERASVIHRVADEPADVSYADGLESYWASIHEGDRPELRQKFLAMAQGELESSSQTYRLHPSIGRDGSPVYIRLHALVDRSDQDLRILGAVTDVTTELRVARENAVLQSQIHQFQKMEAVGRFAGSIAHDFNNLLTPIVGHTELMQSQLETDDPLNRNVEEIHKAALRSRDIIQQLLAFDGDPTLAKRPLDISAVVIDSESIRKTLVGANVSVELDLLQPAMVVANRGQLERTLVNLAANGRDAIHNTGRLRISTSTVEIGAESVGAHSGAKIGSFIQLKVEDDGGGMNEATLAQVFEPYFTTKELGRGTGLGMYTIYNFVQQHGGFIEIESSENVGTTVSIHLPLARLAPSAVDIL